MKKTLPIIFIILIVIALVGGGIWYFFLRAPSSDSVDNLGSTPTGFSPFGRTPVANNQTPSVSNSTSSPASIPSVTAPIPALRLLSGTPIGGYGASTTATTTFVRWIDRGRGNIYEVTEGLPGMNTLSNTILPRVFMSVWNKNLTAFIGSMFPTNSEIPNTVYASLIAQNLPKSAATSTLAIDNSSVTPYMLKGSALPGNIIGYAESPKKDKVFFFIDDNGKGAGYVASITGAGMTEIFSTPLTEVNVDWPSDNIISITTKGSADQGGYLYFVNPQTGAWTKILGPLAGLSAKVSHDGKYAIVSVAGADSDVLTSIYNIQKGTGNDAVVQTLADKCAWGNFYKNLVYCGVPSQQIAGTYPDDWYKGTISFADKIWQINADTGELHLVSSIVDQSDRLIDAFDMSLDPKDDYLFFMNKNDLSFWSLDLVDSSK